MTTAEARQLRARLAGELGRVRALLSRVDALPPQQDGGQRRRLAAADPSGPDLPPALLEAMQRRCAEILTRLRKSKNSVWFNSPVDVEGLKLHDYTDTRVRFAERARRRPWQGRPSATTGGDGGTRKQRGKGDAAVSPFYWGLRKCYWGLRKNIGKKEIKNQFVGASFFTINPLY